jgi:hypothetical protein
MHLYAVKVEKTQKFLDFHKMKFVEDKRETPTEIKALATSLVTSLSSQNINETNKKPPNNVKLKTPPSEHQQGDVKLNKKQIPKKKSPSDMKFMEAMTLEEFANTEKVDKSLLNSSQMLCKPSNQPTEKKETTKKDTKLETSEIIPESLDPIVLIDGRPARQGAALDKQITLFYKMECCICHEK